MRRRPKQQSGSPEWMVTFSDLMTLLLVFFVLLFSFSQIDANKFKAFLVSFQGIGILDSGSTIMEEMTPETQQTPAQEQQSSANELQQSQSEKTTEEVYELVQNFLVEMGLEGEVEARIDIQGVALDVKDRILFDSGKAELKKEAKNILDPLAKLFGTMNQEIWVEGHTDNRPISTREYPTNWELSTARAARVVRYFTENKDLNPQKFVAIGYGEFRPVAPNTSADNMQLNRRVVMIIRTREIEQREVIPVE